jgi:hypothetical protein
MTQKQLIKEYLYLNGSILPAKLAGVVFKGKMFGSETSKRCREMRAEGILKSEGDGKFERFYLASQNLQPPKTAYATKLLTEWSSKPKINHQLQLL